MCADSLSDHSALRDEDDFSHYFNATGRLTAEVARLRAENEALHKRVVRLERAVCRVATIDDFYGPGGRRAAAEVALASDEIGRSDA
jgi:hypothetical protein